MMLHIMCNIIYALYRLLDKDVMLLFCCSYPLSSTQLFSVTNSGRQFFNGHGREMDLLMGGHQNTGETSRSVTNGNVSRLSFVSK